MAQTYVYNIDKMYTYLRGFLVGANMQESLKALQFAREKHDGQERKNGTPYIVHPLSMACYAIAIGIKDDNIIATILLHDVCEDCGVPVEYLPVNDVVKRGVKYMTVTRFGTDRDKKETKARYYNELLESREAVVCKGIDRYMNLLDSPFGLTDDAIGKNCAETDVYLLPKLKEAKHKWCDFADIFFVLRVNVRSVCDILKNYNAESYDKWMDFYGEGGNKEPKKGKNS